MKVDTIILGAQKCGTSTLFAILGQHPSIEPCQVKEPHFFSTSSNWKRDLSNYKKLFRPRSNARYLEASTSYTFYPHRRLGIWNDLYEYNPNMKLIYLVRNPTDRIISSYMDSFRKGYTNADIEDILFKHPLFLNATRYYTQIIPFIRRFGRDKVQIIDFDEMVNKREETLRKVSEFLEISFDGFQNYQHVHRNKSIGGSKNHFRFEDPGSLLKAIRGFFPNFWTLIQNKYRRGDWMLFPQRDRIEFIEKPRISKECREAVLHMLDWDIEGLQELLGKDLSEWKPLYLSSSR